MTAGGGAFDFASFVPSLAYKPGWTFKKAGPGGRFLCIFATTPDSLAPERQRTTQHMFEIPPLQDRRAAVRLLREDDADAPRLGATREVGAKRG